jgi:hypothetical protein
MQNGQAAANEAAIRTSFKIRLSSFPSWCATNASNTPEPMAALGYQARILAGSILLPVILSETQMPSLRKKGVFRGGSIKALIVCSIMIC